MCADYGEESGFEGARELILKARKEGFTSLILALFAASMCLESRASNSLEISYKDEATRQHYRRIKNFFYSLITHDTRKWGGDLDKQIFSSTREGAELVFKDNHSSFYVGTANSRTGERGGTVQRILFSEEAHYPDTGILSANEIIEGTKSMVGLGIGWIFHESTANGFNHYRRRWMMAKSGEIEDRPRFFGWRDFYSEAEFKRICAGFADKSLIPQEFPETDREAFLASGRPLFNQSKLLAMEKRLQEPVRVGYLRDDKHRIEVVDDKLGHLTIWKMPRAGRKYMIPADVAEGVQDLKDLKQVKADDRAWSVAPVFDRASWEVVAELRIKCNPGEFGRMLDVLGEFYNWAVLVPEMNNHGHATLEALKHEGYPHILSTRDIWPEGESDKLGFPTDARTKALILTALKDAIDNEAYHENSPVAVDEMLGAVVDENGKMVSNGGFLDCVMTRAIGLYCLKFLTVDESYRNKRPFADKPVVVTSVAGVGRRKVNREAYR